MVRDKGWDGSAFVPHPRGVHNLSYENENCDKFIFGMINRFDDAIVQLSAIFVIEHSTCTLMNGQLF